MRFRGTVYRAHNPQWSWDPLSGEGARRHGGRFNRPGIPSLYTSLSPLAAIREAEPLGRPMQPLVLCAYEVDVETVFDARNRTSRDSMSVNTAELACPAWEAEMHAGAVPASQALADRLVKAGYVGMLVRSLAAGSGTDDINLVLWNWGPGYPSRVILIDDEGRLSRG
ncbi:MAG: RES domain-containing protein [Rhodobacteraceae bacterium]|nr:RES domain-containing protein [Paracoccaceae bacterium]MCY4141552.1 RES domain-containing protein [Paracoccaceae bacterium]